MTTRKTMTSIKQVWSEQESTSGNNVVRNRVDSVPNLNCFVGLIGVTGAKMFQIEFDSSVSIHKNYLRKFRGVEIQVLTFNFSWKEFTIILLEKELTDIFVLFIEDLIEKLQPITDTNQALVIINQRVNYWKKLFSWVTGELLNTEKQRGLYGELFFLNLLLNTDKNHADALYSWRGSNSANQDFTWNRNAVEIKTTKASNLSVHIANEQQLDFTVWDNLFLGLILVTESSGSQNSLAQIINEIKTLLSYDSKLIQELETKLELAGISTDMVEDYNEISFFVNNSRFFQIREGFPAIARGNLSNDAIYNIKYQIDISSCISFEVQEEEVLKIIL